MGMATYDDFDGTYFTVMALRLYHSEVVDRFSILIVDNNPRYVRWVGKRSPGMDTTAPSFEVAMQA